jgi:hypothetical protein
MKSETRKDYFDEISDIKVALLASSSYAELEKVIAASAKKYNTIAGMARQLV